MAASAAIQTGDSCQAMTARHQIRIGNRRLGRDRAAIDATPAPRLGEMLQLARERKGVDLFRAERDTKIRLKYLAALEDSNFADLPAPVYTKGFLRNYAIYLALDPEEVLQRWRDELQLGRKAERPTVVPPPRPIAAPRRAPTISAGIFIAGLVLLAVLGFVGYIGYQMMRFIETPAVSLTNPPRLVSEVNAESITLSGTSGPGALLSIHGPGGQLLTAVADETGVWSREVPLSLGQNDFTVTANDPVTRRDSPPLNVIVTVPLPADSPVASASPLVPGDIRLSLVSPAEGSTSNRSAVTVSGSTTGTRITIGGEFLAPLAGEPVSTPSVDPNASPEASPSGAPDGAALDITLDSRGAFSESLELSPGRWQITVTSFRAGQQPVSQTRTITVRQLDELVLVIEAARGDSWLRIVPDGEVMKGWGGPTLRRGNSVTVTAGTEIYLRTGNAGAIRITLNGVDRGPLGRNGEVGNWLFRPGMEPERTERR